MNIVFIITGLSIGGAEMMLYNLVSRLSNEFVPHVISLTTIGAVGQSIRTLGIPVEALGMVPEAPNPLNILRLARRLKEIKPHIVHTWMYHADLVGGLAARMANVPALAWCIRNSTLDKNVTKWSRRAVVPSCALLSRVLPDRIVSCSRVARDIHIAQGYDTGRFVVIPNGFDLNVFRADDQSRSSVRAELGIPRSAPVIGMFARFHPQKDHQGFFQAAKILHPVRPDLHFLLAGNDVDQSNPTLVDWVHQANVGAVTHLLGPRQDIPRLYTALDIYTISSRYGEAFPVAGGESMACEVPCVVTDVGDSAYLVGNTGRVVPPSNPAALAQGWAELLDMSELERRELGALARARVEEHFDICSVIRRYEELYHELGRGCEAA
jgi:glycosyltransferase involved in cell wall biosynthesis